MSRIRLGVLSHHTARILPKKRVIGALDGFGAADLIQSLRPLGSANPESQGRKPLEGVQILTRYFEAEEPYWYSFVKHYRALGSRIFHVCIQYESEAQRAIAVGGIEGVEIVVHMLEPGTEPGAAFEKLDVSRIKNSGEFTLMVDVDEYFHAFNSVAGLGALFGLYPGADQVSLPWLISPNLSEVKSGPQAGFWGHVGKPACRSDALKGIADSHLFDTGSNTTRIVPLGPHGVALIHYWSRTFRDCLLKIFISRFVTAKNSDQQYALAMIRRGELPVRLRLLAYLANHSAFIPAPSAPVHDFDLRLEEELLRRSLSESDEEICLEIFSGYRELLSRSRGRLPLYPAVSLRQLAPLLPSLSEMRSWSSGG